MHLYYSLTYLSIFEDRANNLWIGTKDGLNCFDKNLEVFERFETTPEENSLSDNRVKSIYEDNDGDLWIGTENGLNLMNRRSKTFTRYLPFKQHCPAHAFQAAS